MFKQFFKNFKKFLADAKQDKVKHSYSPTYRVIEIYQDKHEQHYVRIQVAQKNIIFNAKPEELLAKDSLVDKFSPRDVRTMTYLGYLGINAPKYKILAQRFSDENDELFFALKEKGNDKVVVKTAEEIIRESEILEKMHPSDAHTIGYSAATEQAKQEKLQMEELKKLATTKTTNQTSSDIND